MSEQDREFERALLRADIRAGNSEAAMLQYQRVTLPQGDDMPTTDRDENIADPYGQRGGRRWFWWADASYLRPGLHFRHRRVLPMSLWILRPRYSWRVRGIGSGREDT